MPKARAFGIFTLVRIVGVQILLNGKLCLARFNAFGDVFVGVLHLLAVENATFQKRYNLVVVVGQR
jgi:hypothetical protein